MIRRVVLSIFIAALFAVPACAAPSNAQALGYCYYAAGASWLPILGSGTGDNYSRATVDLYGFNSGTYYPLNCDANGNLQTSMGNYYTAPSTCSLGQTYYNTTSNIPYYCGPTPNTWTAFGTSSGSGIPPPPGGAYGSFPYFLVENPAGTGIQGTWVAALPGTPGRTVTGATDTVAATDRASTILYNYSGAVAVSYTAPATLGSNLSAKIVNIGTGSVVTFTLTGGPVFLNTNAATYTAALGDSCTFSSPDNVNVLAACSPGQLANGTGISVTGSATGKTIALSGAINLAAGGAGGVTGVLPSANMGPPTVTVSSGSIAAVTTNNTYIICTTTCNVTPLQPAAGVQLCVRNAPGSATVITLNALSTGNGYSPQAYYELTTHAAWGTLAHAVTSGGVATDSICLVGYDSSHYAVMSYTGTWTD